jgi:hypothetical protein
MNMERVFEPYESMQNTVANIEIERLSAMRIPLTMRSPLAVKVPFVVEKHFVVEKRRFNLSRQEVFEADGPELRT